ncbi:MAG TPA: ComEC/Rec2 family competence protein [Terriglobales bacterium]|nr:ComEC/Rec2 family competence protein [Terriglobales bacterium]
MPESRTQMTDWAHRRRAATRFLQSAQLASMMGRPFRASVVSPATPRTINIAPPEAAEDTSNPSRQPLFWAAILFSLGHWCGLRVWRPPAWWAVAIVVFVLGACWFVPRRTWPARCLALTTWVLFGALLIQVRGLPHEDPNLNKFSDGQPVTLTAHVVREGYSRAGLFDAKTTIDVESETIENGGGVVPVRAGIRLTLLERGEKLAPSEKLNADPAGRSQITISSTSEEPAQPPFPSFQYGERLRIHTKLHRPRNFRNPGTFDYEGYLRDNSISLLGSAAMQDVERLPGFYGSRVSRWRAHTHASIIAKIHRLWPASQAILLDAMVLGEESFLRGSMRTEFQRSGTYHLLVVSGMNLSILAVAIFWTLRRFRLDPALAAVATVVVSFTYAFVVGVGPPVWRAALMLAIYLGARLLYRGRNMLNAIGAAAIGVLIADPDALFGASFQLTFLAVFIIAGIGQPLLERTTLPYARGLRLLGLTSYDVHLEQKVAQLRLDLRLIGSRLSRFIGDGPGLLLPASFLRGSVFLAELVFVSALMQAGLALPMAYYFHRATTMGMPANLFVIPLTQVLMPAAATAVLLGGVALPLGRPAAWIAGIALEGITGTVHWLGGAQTTGGSIADLRVAMPSLATTAAAVAALVFAMWAARQKRAAALASLAGLVGVACWITFAGSHLGIRPGVLEMTALDVGQGDSILLVTPQGRTMLVDSGGLPMWMHSDFDMGEQVVSPYLWYRGIDHLDTVVITHPHADHLGGMPAIIANFHPRELWISMDEPMGELAPVVAQAKRAGMKVYTRKEGDEFDYGGAHFRLLAPGRDQATGTMRPNDDCLVFTVAFGATAALLEGDAERPVERHLVELHPEAVLLKVAHHGSASGTSSALLSTVHPRYAVISVGARNVYGHPRREVLQRLQDAGVLTYRTDEQGATTFYLDGRNVVPEVATIH